MADSAWDPDQYLRFAAERRRPFDDLLAQLEPVPGGRAVDLGCGTGELTVELHAHLGAAETVGIDDSVSMLERARDLAAPGVRFELGRLEEWAPAVPVDVVFANASLHWVPDHPALLARLVAGLARRWSAGLPGAGQPRPPVPPRGRRARRPNVGSRSGAGRSACWRRSTTRPSCTTWA